MKRINRLTESDLHRIVRESVKRVLKEDEWQSPLEKTKKNKNDFDNVKKIDLSKFQSKKPKKSKSGTFGDLPSFAKLKNLKMENRFNRTLKEAESFGWVVDSSEAQEAYNMAVEHMGEEEINRAIVRSLGNETLAQCLAFIFRNYDFREWDNR